MKYKLWLALVLFVAGSVGQGHVQARVMGQVTIGAWQVFAFADDATGAFESCNATWRAANGLALNMAEVGTTRPMMWLQWHGFDLGHRRAVKILYRRELGKAITAVLTVQDGGVLLFSDATVRDFLVLKPADKTLYIAVEGVMVDLQVADLREAAVRLRECRWYAGRLDKGGIRVALGANSGAGAAAEPAGVGQGPNRVSATVRHRGLALKL